MTIHHKKLKKCKYQQFLIHKNIFTIIIYIKIKVQFTVKFSKNHKNLKIIIIKKMHIYIIHA